MKQNNSTTNYKKLDSYSVLICSKYLKSKQDFINLVCVNSKFKETTEKLRFNPIPIKSLKLFPKIQTQYLYNNWDKKIKGIDKYEIWHEIVYDRYLQFKKENIVKCHYLEYTYENRMKYGDNIPAEVNIFGNFCFGGEYEMNQNPSTIKEITIPSTIKSLGVACFNSCISLQSIILPSSLTSIDIGCFESCSSLTSIIIPLLLKSLSARCFSGCYQLKSINLPSTLEKIDSYCFEYCSSLTSINLPSTLTTFAQYSFTGCDQLKGKINVPNECFDRFTLNI
ncbi:Leucine rich repeat protein bspa family [Entamoeba marina]